MLQTTFKQLNQSPKTIAFFICVAYGGLMEIMQGTLFIERNADIFDFIANSFGCTMAVVMYNWMEKKFLVKIIK